MLTDVKTDEVLDRLMRFVETTDGFRSFGTRSWNCAAPATCSARGNTACRRSSPPICCATPRVLVEARDDAAETGRRRSRPALADHAQLRRMVLSRYGQALDLGDVG